MEQSNLTKPRQRAAMYWYLAIISLFLVMRLLFWFSPSHAEKINIIYFWPLAIAAAALVITQRHSVLSWRYALPPIMAGWLLFSCIVNGDAYLIYNRTFMLGIFLSYISFFLVVPSLSPAKREQGFQGLAALYCGLMLLMALLGISVAFTGHSFTTVLSDESIHVTQSRLYFFKYHPNEAGSALVVAFYLTLYLFAAWHQIIARILLMLTGCVFALTIALTGSRTAILLAAAGAGVLIYWAIYTYAFCSHKWLRWPVGLTAVAVVMVGLYLGLNFSVGLVSKVAQQNAAESVSVDTISIDTAVMTADASVAAPATDAVDPDDDLVKVVSSRVQMEDIGTFNMRVGIWQSGLNYLKAHPCAYLFGVPDNRVARIPQEAGRTEMHMHNAYLEMLLLGGLPGLLLYVMYLLLLFYSGLRLAFFKESNWGRRFLGVIPLMIAVNGVTEIYPMFSGNVMDMMYFTISGAVISLSTTLPPRRSQQGQAV